MSTSGRPDAPGPATMSTRSERASAHVIARGSLSGTGLACSRQATGSRPQTHERRSEPAVCSTGGRVPALRAIAIGTSLAATRPGWGFGGIGLPLWHVGALSRPPRRNTDPWGRHAGGDAKDGPGRLALAQTPDLFYVCFGRHGHTTHRDGTAVKHNGIILVNNTEVLARQRQRRVPQDGGTRPGCRRRSGTGRSGAWPWIPSMRWPGGAWCRRWWWPMPATGRTPTSATAWTGGPGGDGLAACQAVSVSLSFSDVHCRSGGTIRRGRPSTHPPMNAGERP